MIPLDDTHEVLYAGWLRSQHPRTWAHYLALLRSLRREVAGREVAIEKDLERWLNAKRGETRRAARKGMRKYLQWLDSHGTRVPAPSPLAKSSPERTLALAHTQRLRQRQSGTVLDRQIYTMVELHQGTELPASAVGQLCAKDLAEDGTQILWRGRPYVLPPEARLALQRWLRVRERLRSLPEEQRRHRKTEAWTHSPFLFPNARGQASGYGVIWRARQIISPEAQSLSTAD